MKLLLSYATVLTVYVLEAVHFSEEVEDATGVESIDMEPIGMDYFLPGTYGSMPEIVGESYYTPSKKIKDEQASWYLPQEIIQLIQSYLPREHHFAANQ